MHIINYHTGPGRLHTQLNESFWQAQPIDLSVTSKPTKRKMESNADRGTAQTKSQVAWF